MAKIQQLTDELLPLRLTDVEKRVLEALVLGDEAVSGIKHPAIDQEFVHGFPAVCTIGAEFLSRLCACPGGAEFLSRRGIRLRGYKISGPLDFSSMDIPFPVSLRNCSLREGITLKNSSLVSLDLADSCIAGLDAAGMRLSGELRLSEGFTSDYPVYLRGVHIEGDVVCIGGHFSHRDKLARCRATSEGCVACRAHAEDAYVLVMEHARVDGSVYLCGNFTAEGGVQLTDATIGVNLNCTKAKFNSTLASSAGALLESGRRLCCEGALNFHLACAFNGDGLRVKGNILMNEVTVHGELRLTDAEVAGDVESAKGSFIPHGAEAVYADRLTVGGNLFFCDGFEAQGIIRLPSAKVQKDLTFFNASIFPQSGHAVLHDDKRTILNCESLEVGGTMYLSNFNAAGCVRLSYSVIGGNFVSRNARFKNEGGVAMEAFGLKVRGTVFMDEGVSAAGIVKFTGSEVGADFMCSKAKFNASNPCALNLNCISVGGKMRLDGGFRADGGVCLDDSKIGSYLRCDGGTFIAPKRKEGDSSSVYAISAGKLNVGASVYFDWYLDERFVAEGEVMLNDFSTGRNLKCEGASLSNPGGVTLRGSQMNVTGSVLMNNRFESNGAVEIQSAVIGGDLVCTGGKFINPSNHVDASDAEPKANGKCALMAEGNRIGGHVLLDQGFEVKGRVSLRKTEIGGTLSWVNVKNSEEAELDLRFATAELLEDDPQSWPKKIQLNGFVYNCLHNPTFNLGERIDKWLKSPRFRPQPYEHLADVLRRTGYQRLSEKVLIRKNKEEAHLPIKWPLDRILYKYKEQTQLEKEGQTQSVGMFLWMHILEYGVCYGYKSFRAVLWAVVLTVGLSFFYHHGLHTGYLEANEKDGPVSMESYEGWRKDNDMFLALMYSLDTTLPAINLNIHDHYTEAEASNLWINANRVLHVVHTMLGWLLTLLFGAALAGIIRR